MPAIKYFTTQRIYKRGERTGRDRNSNKYILRRRIKKIKFCPRSLILTTTWIPCHDSCSWWSLPATRAPSPRARPETSRASSSGVCLARLVIPECPARKSALVVSYLRSGTSTVHQLSLNEHLLAILAFSWRRASTRTRSHSRGHVHDPDANRLIRSSWDLSVILPGCFDNGHWSPSWNGSANRIEADQRYREEM